MSLIHLGDDTSVVTKGNPLPVAPYQRDSYFEVNIQSSNATTPVLLKAATSGKKIYITDIILGVKSAGDVDIRTLQAGPTLIIGVLPMANTSTFSHTYVTPRSTDTGQAIYLFSTTSGVISCQLTGYVE
jgi:hypothetical protein